MASKGKGGTAVAEAPAEAEVTESTEGNGNGNTERASRVGRMPTYGIEKLGGDLPANAPRKGGGGGGGGRSNLYLKLLAPLVEDPAEWYKVATFKTTTGATNALKELKNGSRKVPEGEWEFQSRRIPDPTDPVNTEAEAAGEVPKGRRISVLFARFMG